MVERMAEWYAMKRNLIEDVEIIIRPLFLEVVRATLGDLKPK